MSRRRRKNKPGSGDFLWSWHQITIFVKYKCPSSLGSIKNSPEIAKKLRKLDPVLASIGTFFINRNFVSIYCTRSVGRKEPCKQHQLIENIMNFTNPPSTSKKSQWKVLLWSNLWCTMRYHQSLLARLNPAVDDSGARRNMELLEAEGWLASGHSLLFYFHD